MIATDNVRNQERVRDSVKTRERESVCIFLDETVTAFLSGNLIWPKLLLVAPERGRFM